MIERSTTDQVTVVANRLPVAWDEDIGDWRVSPGGLVSALAPILREGGGTWVGWSERAGEEQRPFVHEGIRQVPMSLSAEEVEFYYEGFCNGTVWPLYHDAIRSPEIHRHWWRSYQQVNRRFAEAAADHAWPDHPVWVHDYQLQLVPAILRQINPRQRIGFFLHIPFPPPEVFGRLPWRTEMLQGLLGADVIGFQTHQSALNFARAARMYAGVSGPAEALSVDGRTVRAESVPISIDFDAFEQVAQSAEVVEASAQIRDQLGSPDLVVLGVDRLDYTKGIDLRMRAFDTLLERRPDLHGRIVMVQVAVPSRGNVEEYQVIRETIEQWVGHINGTHGQTGWVPIHYLHRSLPRSELVAHYRAADVMLVTPLRDGMNLVAKEYIAARNDLGGVLVLSEFAGAAEQLDRALLVNPYDLDGLADMLETAIDMPPEEQAERLRGLRRSVRRWNVYTWARMCLESILT